MKQFLKSKGEAFKIAFYVACITAFNDSILIKMIPDFTTRLAVLVILALVATSLHLIQEEYLNNRNKYKTLLSDEDDPDD